MKLHRIHYTCPIKQKVYQYFCTSSAQASKKKTQLKRDSFEGIKAECIEIDTRRAGLIAWLNKEFGE